LHVRPNKALAVLSGDVFGDVGLTQHDRAGSAQPRHDDGVGVWDEVRPVGPARRRTQTHRRERVFDRDRYTMQRACHHAASARPVAGVRSPARTVGIDGYHGVQLGIEPFDPL
jgi:hypothetical protein